eukprot:TRINITY_DN24124_c0_g1_i1.p1 TRINITY_DN24124_c0_g1~~TRINITY_DN24124_c0_g1_i1.p1  ORF type:complete len:181 (+),score=15.87 TRINITY_DN24124_c0_g1_i1:58-600(+)
MHGLRAVNNCYVAAGDGRDLHILHDHGYRGGKHGAARLDPYWPGSKMSLPSPRRPRSVGCDANSQFLNTSRPMSTLLREAKARLAEAERGRPLRPMPAWAERGDANATFTPRQVPFTPRWELPPAPLQSARPWSYQEARDGQLTSATTPRKATPADVEVEAIHMPARAGFSRTNFGGMWP